MKIFFSDATFDALISQATRNGYDRGAKNAEEYFKPLFENEKRDSAEKLEAAQKEFGDYRTEQRAKFDAYKSEQAAQVSALPISVGASVRLNMRTELFMSVIEMKSADGLPTVCLCAWYDGTFNIVTYWFPIAALTHV